MEAVRERPLSAQGERLLNARFAKERRKRRGYAWSKGKEVCLKRVKGNEFAGRRVKEAVKMEEREAVSA